MLKKKTIRRIVLEIIVLLIPFLIYALYKNGFLIYVRNLITGIEVFKPIYLLIISVIIKFIIDFILKRKLTIDFNLLYAILVSMIVPYNVNYIIYTITFLISYLILYFSDRYFKLNKVCVMYLLIVLVNSLFKGFTYLNPLEAKFNYSFTFLDLLMGRNIGGISSTSIIFSLVAFYILTFNFYYKKDIPVFINFVYLFLAVLYYLITKDNSYILNSEMIFASVFVATLPVYSPYKRITQILYSIFIGILTFIIAIIFDKVIAVYIAILIVSIFNNLELKKKIREKI